MKDKAIFKIEIIQDLERDGNRSKVIATNIFIDEGQVTGVKDKDGNLTKEGIKAVLASLATGVAAMIKTAPSAGIHQGDAFNTHLSYIEKCVKATHNVTTVKIDNSHLKN